MGPQFEAWRPGDLETLRLEGLERKPRTRDDDKDEIGTRRVAGRVEPVEFHQRRRKRDVVFIASISPPMARAGEEELTTFYSH